MLRRLPQLSHPQLLRRIGLGLFLSVWLAAPAFAGPEGEQVIHGEVQFSRDGSLTQIQASHNSIINYQSFDIAGHETVQFLQPGSSARVLNRILGNDPTQIDGSLLANGQVYFINPAGIFVGANALIDVAGLFAAAGSISNEDFLGEINRFTDLSGPVENLGTIQGEFVHLLGEHVANYGSIVAENGVVMLLAGDDVYIAESGGRILIKLEGAASRLDAERPGVDQAGEIHADNGQVVLQAGDLYSLAVRHPGKTRADDILLAGGDEGVVNVSGMLDASDAVAGRTGGTITVLGERIELTGAVLDASGDAGGGEVLVGGDAHGAGEVRTASEIVVSADTEIHADALTEGDGGKVVLWADDSTRSYGRISARGGATSGDGGFVETSGRKYLEVSEAPDLAAPHGKGGSWLLDPENIRICSSLAGDCTTTDGAIEAVLNVGGNVTLSTDVPTQSEAGNITQDSDAGIEKTSGGDANLSFLAANNLVLSGGIESTSGALNVVMTADDAAQSGHDPSPGVGTLALTADLRTLGGTASFDASTTIIVNGEVDTAGGDAVFGLNSAPGLRVNIGFNVSTGGGTLRLARNTRLTGTGANANQRLDAGSGTLRIGADVTKTSAGNVDLAAGSIVLDAQNALDPRLAVDQIVDGGSGRLRARGSITKTTLGDLELAGGLLDLRGDTNVTLGSLLLDSDSVEAAVVQARDDIDVDGIGGISAQSISAQTGALSITGVALVSGDIDAGDSIEIGGFTNAGGNITAGTDLTLDEGVFAQNLQALGYIEVGGPATIQDSVTAGEDAVFDESLSAGGTVSAVVDVDIGGVAVINEITAGGDIFIGDAAFIAGSIRTPDGSIDIGGLAEIQGNIEAGGDILLFDAAIAQNIRAGDSGDVDILGPVFIFDAIEAGGSISIGGNVTAAQVSAGAEIEIGDEDAPVSVEVERTLSANETLIVFGDVTAKRINTGEDGDIEISGFATTVSEIEAGGSITIGGDVDADRLSAGEFGDIDVSGLTTVSKEIEAGGSITLRRDASAESITATDDDIDIFGNATIEQGIEAGGGVSIDGVVTATNISADFGDIEVSGTVTVTEAIDASDGVSIEGDVTAARITAGDGDVEVIGSVTVTEEIEASDSVLVKFDVSADSITAEEGEILIEGGASVTGDVSAGDDVTIVLMAEANSIEAGGSIEIGGATTVTEALTAVDDIILNADVTAGDISAGNDVILRGSGVTVHIVVESTDDDTEAITDGSIQAGNDVDIRGLASIQGSLIAAGDLALGGETSVGENLSAGNNVTLEAGAQVGGDARVNGDLTLAGDLQAGGNLTLEGTSTLSGGTQQTLGAGGNLQLNGDVKGDRFILSAGDGSGQESQVLLADTTTFFNEEGSRSPSSFSLSQEADLEALDPTRFGTTALGGVAGMDYTLESTGGKVTILRAADVAESQLTLRSGDQGVEVATDLDLESLVIDSSGSVSMQSITSDGELEIIGGNIELNSSLQSRNDLTLGTTGRSKRGDGATIASSGGLELRSLEGNVIMIEGSRMFVGGDAQMQAGTTFFLADTSVDGVLHVEADNIVLVDPRADPDSNNGFVTKEGINRVNFYGDTIDFSVTPSGSAQIFGTPEARAGVTSDPLAAFDVILTGGTLATSGDPIPAVTGEAINRETTVELPPLTAPGVPMVQQLAQVGAQRPLWPDELVAFLDCAALAKCTSWSPSAVSDTRLAAPSAQAAVLAYRALFIELEPMRNSLQEAVDAFQTEHPGATVTGTELHRFLTEDASYAVALAYIHELDRLFGELENLDMTEREPGETRLMLLNRILLTGIAIEELDGAVRSVGEEAPTLSYASRIPRFSR